MIKKTKKQMSLGQMSLIIGVITVGSNYLFSSIINSNNNQRYNALYNELNDLKHQLKKDRHIK